MARLVFYSGGQERSNHLIHQKLLELATDRNPRSRKRSMTYIPFCSEGSRLFFQRAVRRYRSFGFNQFQCLPVDEAFSRRDLSKALRSDVVYLAGGNTFYFLKHLRSSGLLPKLREYVKKGGVLAGLSAGGLLLTPHIGLAGYPSFDADENEVGLKNLKALSLVRFEFFPHFRQSVRLVHALKKYSIKARYPLIACADGSGIIINQEKRILYGKATLFSRGQMIHVHQLS